MNTNDFSTPSPNSRHIAVHLVALQTTAVSAAQLSLSQSSQGITPQAFAQALRNLPPQWPDDDSLVLQVNAGQPGEKTWFASDMVRSVLSFDSCQVQVLISLRSVRRGATRHLKCRL
jgi:hypothetical protein